MLEYFKREKNFLRKMAHEFSLKFPKVAGHLNFGSQDSGDPAIERLIESVAFMVGNVQRVVEGDFPKVSNGLLGILYPNLINPIPSMSIVRFDLTNDAVPDGGNEVVPKNSVLFAETTSRKTCTFRTAYDVDLVPIEVTSAAIEPPERYAFLEKTPNISAVLRLSIKLTGGESFAAIGLKKLRFYLNGDSAIVGNIYDSIFCNLEKIAILPGPPEKADDDKADEDIEIQLKDEEELEEQDEPIKKKRIKQIEPELVIQPIYLPNDSVQQVGFRSNEDIIPSTENGHPAYRYLQEYFCFPEKFHFVDVLNLDQGQPGQSFDLLLMLNSNPRIVVDENNFNINCTPIINLYENNSTSLKINQDKDEYLLVPDDDEDSITEVHSVTSISTTYGDGEEQKLEPFYGFGHDLSQTDPGSYWYLRREESWRKDTTGTDVFLSFRDLSLNLSPLGEQIIYISSLCSNRDLAERLPGGALLEPREKGLFQQAVCLKKPTAALTPPLKGKTLWNLISNMSLNYLSLTEGKKSLIALREILRSYNFAKNTTVEQQIMGIRSLECKKTLNHTGFEGWRGFYKGFEVTITFDISYFAGSSAFLFGSVLNRFFSLYVSVESFTETVLKTTDDEGEWKRFSPETGEKAAL